MQDFIYLLQSFRHPHHICPSFPITQSRTCKILFGFAICCHTPTTLHRRSPPFSFPTFPLTPRRPSPSPVYALQLTPHLAHRPLLPPSLSATRATRRCSRFLPPALQLTPHLFPACSHSAHLLRSAPPLAPAIFCWFPQFSLPFSPFPRTAPLAPACPVRARFYLFLQFFRHSRRIPSPSYPLARTIPAYAIFCWFSQFPAACPLSPAPAAPHTVRATSAHRIPSTPAPPALHCPPPFARARFCSILQSLPPFPPPRTTTACRLPYSLVAVPRFIVPPLSYPRMQYYVCIVQFFTACTLCLPSHTLHMQCFIYFHNFFHHTTRPASLFRRLTPPLRGAIFCLL